MTTVCHPERILPAISPSAFRLFLLGKRSRPRRGRQATDQSRWASASGVGSTWAALTSTEQSWVSHNAARRAIVRNRTSGFNGLTPGEGPRGRRTADALDLSQISHQEVDKAIMAERGAADR